MTDKNDKSGLVTYRNLPISKLAPKVFKPANRCIYCPDGKPPFTKEHVVPKGMGGGMIFPKASCTTCQKIINEIETYCMRGPFLSHRLKLGLVTYLHELGESLPMKFNRGSETFERRFTINEYPNYLVLPQLFGPPGILVGAPPQRLHAASFKLWGVEEEVQALNEIGNAMLLENFDLDKFSRAIAKIAHGFILEELRPENIDPYLPEFILGKTQEKAAFFIGDWPEDGMARPDNVLHQIGMVFFPWGQRTQVQVRLRLFAAHALTPIYRIVVGELTQPINHVLAQIGLRAIHPSA